jgi:hypothetical protein
MDTLTGQGNASQVENANDTLTDGTGITISRREIDDALADSLRYQQSTEISPEFFETISKIDPNSVSDKTFMDLTSRLDNYNFVRSAFLTYLRRESEHPPNSPWMEELGSEMNRRSFLEGLRDSPEYATRWYTRNPLVLAIRYLNKVFDFFA